MKHFTLLIVAVVVSTACINAQSFEQMGDSYKKKTLKLFWRHTKVDISIDEPFSAWTFNFGWQYNSPKKGGLRMRYENPTIGDLLYLLAKLTQGETPRTKTGREHSYGGGFLGWFAFYGNVYASDNVLFSVGATTGDYLFGAQTIGPPYPQTTDPTGYYLHIGPAALLTVALPAGMWVDGHFNYDIPYASKDMATKPANATNTSYPNPHFYAWGIDVHHRSGLFGGLRINTLRDRGAVGLEASRRDISIGWVF